MTILRQIHVVSGAAQDITGTRLAIDYDKHKVIALNHLHLVVWKLSYLEPKTKTGPKGWNFVDIKGSAVMAFYSTPEEAIKRVLEIYPNQCAVFVIEP